MTKNDTNDQMGDFSKNFNSCSCRICTKFVESLTDMNNKNLNLYREKLKSDADLDKLKSSQEKDKREWEELNKIEDIKTSKANCIISNNKLAESKNNFETKKIELESKLIDLQKQNEIAKEKERREIDLINFEDEKAQRANTKLSNKSRFIIKMKELDDELVFLNMGFKEKERYIGEIREGLPKPNASNIRLTIGITISLEGIITLIVSVLEKQLHSCFNNLNGCILSNCNNVPYSITTFIVIGMLIAMFSGIWYYSYKAVKKMLKQYMSEKENYKNTIESLQNYLLRFLNK